MSVNRTKITGEEYGNDYRTHILEIYKTYVETAEKISDRRQSANSFFLTINTGLVAFVGYTSHAPSPKATMSMYLLVSLAGVVLCYTWYRLIRSYRDLNSGKFKVIHSLEQRLPVAPFDAEWEEIGKGKVPHLYLPFTKVEIFVPWVFFSLHLAVLLRHVFLMFSS